MHHATATSQSSAIFQRLVFEFVTTLVGSEPNGYGVMVVLQMVCNVVCVCMGGCRDGVNRLNILS